MKNLLGSGDVVNVAAPSGGVTSGVPVLIGAKLFGVPVASAAEGEVFALRRKGEVTYTAEGAGSGQAHAVGDDVYWDNSAKRFTKTSSGNLLVAVATAIKATAGTTFQGVLKQP